jgi:sugar lactone lactonase YvrE
MRSFSTNNYFKILAIIFFVFQWNASRGFPGEIIQSFDLPCKYPTGLAYDGENLWVSDRKSDLLYCLDPNSGQVIKTIQSPGYWPVALAWDGQYLWNTDLKGGTDISEDYNGIVYQVDPESGTVLKTLVSPSSSPVGLTFDGHYLWCIDNRSDEIICFSPDDGTTIISFPSPAANPTGLTFDGEYLWVCDRGKNEIYRVEPASGRVILITDSPGPFPSGICFDGSNLWNIDYQNDKLYQLVFKDDERYLRKKERSGRVIYTHQIKNFGPGLVLSADLHIAIPTDRHNQEISGDPEFNTMPTDYVTDRWGQKTAHFHIENLPAGKTQTIEMHVTANTWEVRYFIFPEEVGSLDKVPEEVRNTYLEDNEKFQINHPVILQSLKEAIGEETNPYWIIRDIFDYINRNMYYEMTGGWNTAPTVISRGNGSCSEYAFVFISMCRAAGIPARYVGSVVVRGEDASMDDVFHRWAEVYLPGYGWIPVDPSRGDKERPRDQAIAIGSVSGSLLITTQSGGGSETLGWTYNSNESWTTEPKTYINIENFADWEVVP